MAAEAKKFQIKIESILGGHSPATDFARADQFRTSIGIDPSLPITESSGVYSVTASGLIRPTPSKNFGTTSEAPRWIIPQPKTSTVYVYDARGSAYSTSNFSSITALSDGGSLSSSTGNGAAYYDNYIYFFKNTNVARYGPLNGTPTFDGTYWTGTLGKTALVHTTYPAVSAFAVSLGFNFPNHVSHRHSDGRLYFADVVDNKGTIHYIATTKTTEEGDTDNGSTYNKVQVGFGLWPTAIESYGSDLAIAFYEGTNQTSARQTRAKLMFWDTTSQNVNKIVWVEFPDEMITAMKNVNGILYLVSHSPGQEGFRLTRFIGGYTFEEVFYSESGQAPAAGAIDGDAARVLFGSFTRVPEPVPCVYSFNLRKSKVSNGGLFNVMGATGGSTAGVTALKVVQAYSVSLGVPPILGWSTGNSFGLDTQSAADFGTPANVWWSQVFRIGQPFKVTKVRIPFAQDIAANMIVTPTLYFDQGETTKTLTEINNTSYSGKTDIVIRPEGAVGGHSFWLGLRWSGTALCTVALPITIEYELIDD